MRAVNLIPAGQRSGASVGAGRSQGGAYAVLALLAGLAVLAVIYGIAHHQIASRRVEAASVTAHAQQAQSAAERLAPYTSFIAMREQRTQTVATLVDSRFDWAHVFHELGRVLPPETSISSLSGTIAPAATTAAAPTAATAAAAATAPAPVTSATPPGSVPSFTLSGCSTSQPEVALTLERLHLIDGVSEVTLQSSGSSAGGASGGCPAHDPGFAAVITFDPLPTTAAVAAAAKATKTVSDTPSASSATPTAQAAPTTSTSKASAR